MGTKGADARLSPSSSANTAIVWLRRDLRLSDHQALALARERAERIVFVYIHAPADEAPWEPGGASRWWLHHSLAALAADLAGRGQRLILRHGPTLTALADLIRETGAQLVTWNRLYEPAVIARDKMIKSVLKENGIAAESCNGALLFEPWEIRTDKGEPYQVFTPFWKRCLRELPGLPPPLPPTDVGHPVPKLASLALDELDLLPCLPWAAGFTPLWQPGETGAHQLLERLEETVAGYTDSRNRPGIEGTSRLSPHLHFGEISPRQIVAALTPAATTAASATGAEAYVSELGWREFAHHLLFHYPHTPGQPLDARFAAYPWEAHPEYLEAWRQGRTGYPIVDAGLRELWTTGWMHNRVRMIAASLLIKNLQTHWLEGARWFWDTLVDADLANNTLGWQWTAGCGADAAPYYRIFNPVLQAERFDPERRYLRRWLPEIARLPDKWIHQPWEAPESVLQAAGVKLGETYPFPIVDFRVSREQALAGYTRIKAAAG